MKARNHSKERKWKASQKKTKRFRTKGSISKSCTRGLTICEEIDLAKKPNKISGFFRDLCLKIGLWFLSKGL